MRNETLGASLVPCSTHGDYQASGTRVHLGRFSRDIWTPCPQCKSLELTQFHLASAEQSAGVQQAKLAAMLQTTAIPKRFLGRSFDNYLATTAEQQRVLRVCRNYADNFERHLERGTGLVLAGTTGTGKGHLASSILQSILPSHVGIYTTMSDLVHLLRAGWGGNKGSSEARVLAELGAVPLLVIDEIGVQHGSAAEQVHLFEVMDRRYRDMQPTILITNEDHEGFKRYVGDRIADRLSETASWVKFEWPSYRLEARKELA
jgi:DNA replication protein DnaC